MVSNSVGASGSGVKYRRQSGVVSEIVDGRAMLIGGPSAHLVTLNPVGTLVWQALATPCDAETVVEAVLSQVNQVSPSTVEIDVRAFLEELSAMGVITST